MPIFNPLICQLTVKLEDFSHESLSVSYSNGHINETNLILCPIFVTFKWAWTIQLQGPELHKLDKHGTQCPYF